MNVALRSGVWVAECAEHGVIAAHLYLEGDRAVEAVRQHVETLHR